MGMIYVFNTIVSAIHYHQTILRGHVCVAGENTNLNMQFPSTEQRYEMELVLSFSLLIDHG